MDITKSVESVSQGLKQVAVAAGTVAPPATPGIPKNPPPTVDRTRKPTTPKVSECSVLPWQFKTFIFLYRLAPTQCAVREDLCRWIFKITTKTSTEILRSMAHRCDYNLKLTNKTDKSKTHNFSSSYPESPPALLAKTTTGSSTWIWTTQTVRKNRTDQTAACRPLGAAFRQGQELVTAWRQAQEAITVERSPATVSARPVPEQTTVCWHRRPSHAPRTLPLISWKPMRSTGSVPIRRWVAISPG